MGGRDPGEREEAGRPPIANTRITIVIRPYLLRWTRREESKNLTKLSRAKRYGNGNGATATQRWLSVRKTFHFMCALLLPYIQRTPPAETELHRVNTTPSVMFSVDARANMAPAMKAEFWKLCCAPSRQHSCVRTAPPPSHYLSRRVRDCHESAHPRSAKSTRGPPRLRLPTQHDFF